MPRDRTAVLICHLSVVHHGSVGLLGRYGHLARRAARTHPLPERALHAPREVTDADGVTWSCIHAFAGLGNDPAKAAAARVDGMAGGCQIVCIPSGKTHSVRVELPGGWEETCPDDEVLAAIRAALTGTKGVHP